ncbi:hypothetical protein [Nocardioides zhouii]|uniref:Uncharacterized protein n=1 Tax=Nocardioides zhouii TaxID=1168729 RepID=A0A4Q2T8G4_9ACTN|nr:hypothetical protein [Nocardioides zhouii]RYC14563.1 hypothetical protein EUA94_00080 [Nocardioides zhouii]
MSATLHDLVTVRARRGREPLHFADDIEALAWIKAEVDELRTQADDMLLIPTDVMSMRLSRVSAVVSVVAVLYGHDERDSR